MTKTVLCAFAGYSVNANKSKSMETLKNLIGDIEIIASNRVGWGKGKNIVEASKNCRKETRKNPIKFFIVPMGSELNRLSITYPLDCKFTMTEI